MLALAHWRLTCVHIPVKDLTSVLTATNLFLKQQILLLIAELTPEKNLFIAEYVIEHFLNQAALQHIWELTVVKDHIGKLFDNMNIWSMITF